MTWLGDKVQISDKVRANLLAKREVLLGKLEALKLKGPSGRFEHNVRHHNEDMTKIASDMVKIDRRLGRCVGDEL